MQSCQNKKQNNNKKLPQKKFIPQVDLEMYQQMSL